MKNFEFEHNGQKYWYSRAMVCVSAIFCLDRNHIMNVLVNKRGTATANENHKWNLPVGYLDHDETLRQCAIREVFEETGVSVPLEAINLYNINSKPDGDKQDVGFRFTALLDGFTDNYKLSTKNMEANEVESVKWLPISEIDDINWAWNHKYITDEILKKKYGIDYRNAKSNVCVQFSFKCPDGVTIDLFGYSDKYGCTDYRDCATYDHKCNDTPENNFLRAYKDAVRCHGKIKPIKNSIILTEFISKIQ